MAEAFQSFVLRLSLLGFAASLAVLVLRAEFVRHLAAGLLEKWKRLTALGRAVVCSFLLVGFLVADKTNGVNNLPPQQMNGPMAQLGGGSFQTGFTGFTGLAGAGNLVNLVNPVQTTPVQGSFAERRAANWNVRGAWRDSFWLDFEDGWVFPWSTNHLSGVEVVSCGQVRATPFDTNAVASVGVPVEIVPGMSGFFYEQTPSNTYRFGWVDAAVNRDTNDLVTAAIELFRNGDVVVTTNGVAAHLPRTLPFPHDGYGQDEEWVAANFTNAVEIAAAGGYVAWVDAQVGTGLTNGLYKLTATVPDDPPETVQLVVGDLSVAVTNAGNYVFLLEKGVDYGYGIIPFMTNVSYSAVDDVPQMRGGAGGLRSLPGDAVRAWTVDGGYGNEPQTDSSLGIVWWMPLFFGSPDVSQHLGPGDGPLEFTANLADCRAVPAASYSWSASEGLTVHSPNAQTTQITVDSMPSWAQAGVSVTAALGNHELYSHLDGFTYGTNSTPQVHLSLNVPQAVLLNSNEVSAAKIAAAGWSFSSDAPTSGVVRVSCLSGSEKVVVSGLVGEWAVDDSYSVAATVEGVGASDGLGDVVFRMEFCGGGATNATERATTVVRVGDVLLPSAPADGLVILTNTPVALVLDCAPQGAGVFLTATWHSRRLKSDGTFEPWQLAAYARPGASLTFTPAMGGIYQVRALAPVAAGGSDERYYVWDADENREIGLKKRGELKAFGVCDEQWQIDLRSCAKSYLGSTEYALMAELEGAYGFSSVDDAVWKCNYFVAHRIRESGLPLQAQRQRLWRSYPPLANEWASGVQIAGWQRIGAFSFVQPGFIVGHPAAGGSGHVGIVDFDGEGIAAGAEKVNRKYGEWLDGTSGFCRLAD